MGANNAKMIDPLLFIQAGINPRTGLPIKFDEGKGAELKQNIKKLLRIVDEQDAINRFKWNNLPDGLDGHLIERILYYKGQGMFFLLDDKFFFLPYALSGTIDVYGRYLGCTPLPFNGVAQANGEKERPWITGLVRKPVYDVLSEDLTLEKLETSCVILSDYSKQISQTTLSRQILNDPLLDVMAECIPFMRTALQNETGTVGMRVNSQDEYSNVAAANDTVKRAALVGDKYVAIEGQIDFQDLTFGVSGKSVDFMQALESLDNFRLGLYGIDNGGLFQKKAHLLQDEQALAGGSTGLVYQDGLTNRQKFCDIVNSIFGLGISVEASENVIGDKNMDGFMEDDEDQSGIPGEQQVEDVGNEFE